MKAYICSNPIGGIEIYFVREHLGKFYLAKPMTLEFYESIDIEFKAEPTLRFNMVEGPQLLKSLSDELFSRGIKPESDSKLLGELQATKVHLEDMRHLVFQGIDPAL